MTQLTHGGDWAGYRAQYGHDALDFSANVSPLGLPQGVANAIAAALSHADRYPDPLCRALRAKLAPHEGIPAESILCGNGAADLIFRLAWAAKPRTALVTAPLLPSTPPRWKVRAVRCGDIFCRQRSILP